MTTELAKGCKIRKYYESVFATENVNAFLTDPKHVITDKTACDLLLIISISIGMEREMLRAMGKRLSELSRFSFSPMTGLTLVAKALGYTGYQEIGRRFCVGDYVPNIRNDLISVSDPKSKIKISDKQVKKFF